MLAGASAAAEERGRDPFAFRAVLDEKPRMLVLALRPDFWVAYDAERAALYKVWEDGVDFTGAVYDWLHGPQPTSRGRAWLVSPWEEPWQVARGGRAAPGARALPRAPSRRRPRHAALRPRLERRRARSA